MLTRAVKLNSFVSSNLKLTVPTVLFGATADATVVVANIQQFKLVSDPIQGSTSGSETAQARREEERERVLGVALKLTRLSLCSNY